MFRGKKGIQYVLFAWASVSSVFADSDGGDHFDETSVEPLIVSLGSFCLPSHALQLSGLRKAAFPFDWIISFDGESLIEMLDDDFQDFFIEEHFSSYGPAGHLLNARYHLEFLHDGDFNGSDFSEKLQKFKTKYQRRIDRFRKLKDYRGKVIFIRSCFAYSLIDPHRFFRVAENIEITEEYAFRLFKALKWRFPDLNYNLIILNNFEGEGVEEVKLSDSLFMSKIQSCVDNVITREKLKNYFVKLFNQELLTLGIDRICESDSARK